MFMVGDVLSRLLAEIYRKWKFPASTCARYVVNRIATFVPYSWTCSTARKWSLIIACGMQRQEDGCLLHADTSQHQHAACCRHHFLADHLALRAASDAVSTDGRPYLQRGHSSINQSINQSIKFIISVAHCRLDFTINSSIAYKFKNTGAMLNVNKTEITIVDETRECLSRQMMLTYSVW